MSLVPILLIGFWGFFYLRDAIGVLAAPGTGLDFRYQGQEGVLHLTADSYAVQIRSGKITLNNPRVQRSDGRLLASANLVRIEDISVAGPSPVSVTVRDLDAELVRLPSGKFEFQSYLPAPREKAGESAFRADIYNSKIRFIDLAGAKPFDQLIRSDHLTVEGSGESWVANGRATMPDVGQANVGIQNSPTTGLTVQASTPRLQLSRLLNHFRKGPEAERLAFLNGISADSIVVSGPFRLVIPKEGSAVIETDVSAEARNLTVREFGFVQRAEFDGLVTQSGARGKVSISKSGGSATFVGNIDWGQGVDLGGAASANVTSLEVLPKPIRELLPKDLLFINAKAEGYVSLVDGKEVSFAGELSANSASIQGQGIEALSAHVTATPKRVLATNAEGLYRSMPFYGNLAYDLETQTLGGMLLGKNVDLGRLELANGLSGAADVQAIIRGTASKPVVKFLAVGKGSFRTKGSGAALAGDFRGRGSFQDGLLTITSGRLETNQGVAVVGGTTTPEGRLDLTVAARGIDLSAFAPELQGRGAFTGRLVGTFADPHLQGRAQITNLVASDQAIPIVVADINANRKMVRAETVQAIRGAATASGSLAYRYSDGRLWGQAQALAVPIPEFSEGLLGQIDVKNAVLSGSLSNPVVSADIGGNVIVPGGLRISNAKGDFRYANKVATVPTFSAELAGGTVTGNVRYEIGSKVARVEFDASTLNLEDLTAQLAEASVLGHVGAKGAVVFHDGQLRYAKADGSLSDVTVNGTLIGSGPWTVNVDPTNITASSQLGSLERYIELEQFAMGRNTDRGEGILTAYQIPIQDLYKALDRYIPDPKTQAEMQIRNLDGLLDARIAFNGPLKDPNIDAQVLEASELKLGGRDLGRLVANVAKQGENWKIDRVNWDSDVGTLRASGVIDESGTIRVDGDLSNFDLSLLSLFETELQRLSGRASVAFAAEGPATSPSIMASLDARQTVVNAGGGGVEFGLVLDTLQLTESSINANGDVVGGIEAQGRLFYQGLEGNVQAHLPLAYPFEIPRNQPLSASLTVPPRSLKDVARYFPGLSEQDTSGQIAGQLTASGTIGNIDLGGFVRANADQLTLSGLRTKFTNTTAEATITSGELKLKAQTGSDKGGAAILDTTVALGDLGERVQDLAARGLQALLERPASGQLSLADFRIDEPFGSDGLIAGTANGTLTASGTLGSPMVAGTVAVADGRFRMPGEELISGEEYTYWINPRFGLNVRITDPMTFSTGTAELNLLGGGTLSGSLTNPDLNADLRVESGQLRLPTARVRIEPGGTLNIRYSVGEAGDLIARADVNLDGRTQVVDVQYGELPQRYNVALNITGNLLSEDEARIQATSEPAGLSQERILALLGEADLITGLVGGAGDLETQKRLRDVLTGFAVPAVLDPLTARLAEGLGLDYLAVSYDPYSRFTLNFARPLGNNLVLQGRRQLSEPLPGLEPEFELKLTYRLPVRSRTFRRVAVSFGMDEQRPWKLEVSYSFRFK